MIWGHLHNRLLMAPNQKWLDFGPHAGRPHSPSCMCQEAAQPNAPPFRPSTQFRPRKPGWDKCPILLSAAHPPAFLPSTRLEAASPEVAALGCAFRGRAARAPRGFAERTAFRPGMLPMGKCCQFQWPISNGGRERPRSDGVQGLLALAGGASRRKTKSTVPLKRQGSG